MDKESDNIQIGSVVTPIEQDIIMFYDKPLVVVRLPTGEPGAVLRSFCDNLMLDLTGQVNRIRRKKAIAKGLQYVLIETDGGPQVAAVLTLRVVPGWLFGIDANRVKPEMQVVIEQYQDECVEALYQWASTPHLSVPTALVSDKPVEQPAMPTQGASREEWRAYYLQMAEFLDWQTSIETWRGTTDQRLDSLEAVIPTILERLPDPTITPAHQNMVKYYISQLQKATGKPFPTLYTALYAAFSVPTYTALREDEWDKIEQWFKKHLNKFHPDDERPEQGRLL